VSKHKICLYVSFFMDEMDGEPEQSAEIAMDTLEYLIRNKTAWDSADVEVHTCYEVIS
jgi:hypothetical protein